MADPRRGASAFYLGPDGTLTSSQPQSPAEPDSYTYDPGDPLPTKGGSIVSYVYPPGSVDVSDVQQRPDVLTYTTGPLERDLDVAGPLRMILFASSSAVDTDFVARLTDVFPDGRAIQLQAGALRTRYRDREGEPSFLEPDTCTGWRSTCGPPRTGSGPDTGSASTSPRPTSPSSTGTPTAAASPATLSRPARPSTTTRTIPPTSRSASCRPDRSSGGGLPDRFRHPEEVAAHDRGDVLR